MRVTRRFPMMPNGARRGPETASSQLRSVHRASKKHHSRGYRHALHRGLITRPQMGIGLQRLRRILMPQTRRHRHDRHARVDQLRRVIVPQLMPPLPLTTTDSVTVSTPRLRPPLTRHQRPPRPPKQQPIHTRRELLTVNHKLIEDVLSDADDPHSGRCASVIPMDTGRPTTRAGRLRSKRGRFRAGGHDRT